MRAPFNKTPRTMTPEGTFMARVVRVIYMGTLLEKNSFQGGIMMEVPKLQITWELPTETNVFKEGEEAKPFVISREYTHSMGPKSNLRPTVESIIGTKLSDDEAYAFDHDELLGIACQITVSHHETESGVWEKVTGVSPLLKGVVCPPQVNPSKILSFEKWDNELFEKLPKFIKDKIISSKEYQKMTGKSSLSSDDIAQIKALRERDEMNFSVSEIKGSEIPF